MCVLMAFGEKITWVSLLTSLFYSIQVLLVKWLFYSYVQVYAYIRNVLNILNLDLCNWCNDIITSMSTSGIVLFCSCVKIFYSHCSSFSLFDLQMSWLNFFLNKVQTLIIATVLPCNCLCCSLASKVAHINMSTPHILLLHPATVYYFADKQLLIH